MAKKNKVFIDVEINGKMQKVAVDAKKLGDNLDDVAKNARTADRNVKGAAQASSNATKNFSKMAQGTNGLVAAYATFAAQVFALTAAFGFFKRAGDLKVLQQGQQAYAAATGTAMKVLAKDIMQAADAQITFRDASQAAAIGVASGLSGDQLTQLGKAAKDVSAVLGRDVTDSFNRLVRGVTKAEPELLDELGIVLRLKTATEEYAETLGKSADDLTAFERSQAVANNVLSQAEEKYSKILEITGGGAANEFNKLTVALDEVVMTIQNALIPVASSVAKVLTDMPILAGASFALFLSGPLRAMGFNLQEVGEKSRVAAFTQRKEFAKNKAAIEAVNISLTQQAALLQANAGKALATGTPGAAGPSKLLQQVDKGGIDSLSPQGSATLKRATDAAVKNVNKNGIVTKGIYKGVRIEIVKQMQTAFKNIETGEKAMVSKSKLHTMQMKGNYLKMSAAVQGATSKMIAGFSRLAGALGWIGLIVMAFGALKNALTVEKPLTDDEKAAERLRNRVSELNKEMEHYIAIQKELTKDGSSSALMNLGASIGKQVGQLGIGDNLVATQAQFQAAEQIKARKANVKGPQASRKRSRIKGPTEEQVEGQKAIQRQIDAIDLLTERSGISFAAFENYKAALNDPNVDPEALNAAASKAQELSNVMNGLPRLMKASDDGISSFVNSFAPLNQAEQAMKDITTELGEYQKLFKAGGLTEEQKERVALLKKEHAFIKQMNEAAHKRTLASMEANQEVERAGLIQQKIARDVAMTAAKQSVAETNVANKKQEIADLQKIITKDAKDEKEALKNATPAQQRQLEILKEQLESLGIKLDLTTQIAEQTEKESKLRKQIQDAQMDTKLLNTSKALLDFDQKRLNITKQKNALDKQQSDIALSQSKREFKQGSAFSHLFQDKFDADADLKAAKALEQAQLDQIKEEKRIKIEMIELEYALLEAKMRQTAAEMRLLAMSPELKGDQARIDSAIGLADKIEGKEVTDPETGETSREGGILQQLEGTKQAAIAVAGQEAETATAAVAENIDKLTERKNDLSDMETLTRGIADSFAGGMTQAFTDLATGAKSAKEAFADMAKSMLANIAKMIAEMLALQLIKSMFPGLSFSGGGIMDNGKKIEGYSTGGVAKGPQRGYPAVLHGTEAVVPLPNGKSIPVEMKQGGNVQNNVTVNVSSEGTTQTSQSNGSDGEKLGKAIAAAVQAELQNQKRSGGILSPYGAA